jgi:ankyrin repeat protein
VNAKRLVAFVLAACLTSIGQAAGLGDSSTLVDAVAEQDGAKVRALLASKADVNGTRVDGSTALQWAAYHDDLEVANLLIAAGARVNASNAFGVTALSLACSNGSAAMVARLVGSGADPGLALSSGETPLMTCARTGSEAAVRALVARGAEIDRSELENGQTALMWAASEGHIPVVQALVGHGASLHARSKSGFTPLMFAAREGHLDAVRLLLGAGAKVNEAAKDGTTALIVATVRGHVDLARLLLKEGADPNAIEPGYTALHWAVGSWETELSGPRGIALDRDKEWRGLRGVPDGKLELVRALLAHGANPNVRLVKSPARFGFSSFQGYQPTFLIGATPFLLAAMAGDADVMRALVAAGADPRLPTKENTTAMMVAAGLGRILQESRVTESRSLEAVKLAWDLGVDVNAVNEAGNTALHGAAHIRSDAIVQFLADKGAQLNVRNKPSNFLLFELPSETPLAIAERTVQPGQAPIHVQTSTGDLLRRLGATK